MSAIADLETALTALHLIRDNHQGDSWSAGVAMSALASIEERSGYTLAHALCDEDGIVRRGAMHHGTDYPCTGHAHYAGEHIVCTSSFHELGPRVSLAGPV